MIYILLELYSLYKQGNEGDIVGERPGFADFEGRAKFDSWQKQTGKSKGDAMRDYISLVEKLENLLLNYDYKTYMMKELSHLLPPLNFWDKNKIQFDSWQKDVIHKIKHKQSVLVKAPTSSGKTFIAMSTGIIHQKILYVCPAKPVVYQVGSHFVKMGYKVHYLVENMSHMSYDSKTNIFIGTPDMIEKYLYKIYLRSRDGLGCIL